MLGAPHADAGKNREERTSSPRSQGITNWEHRHPAGKN